MTQIVPLSAEARDRAGKGPPARPVVMAAFRP